VSRLLGWLATQASGLVRMVAASSVEAADGLARAGLDTRSKAVLHVETPHSGTPIDGIPSETSGLERRFLYTFFARLWDGAGSVVEIGPFLGGTTRAIALGMRANPRRDPSARLYTFDRFEAYYEPEELRVLLEGHSAAAVALEDQELGPSGRFRDVFTALHRDTEYEDLILVRDEPLPDTPEEASNEGILRLDRDVEVAAAFVDGCKSWYSTKYLMLELAEVARPGSHLLFQDYCWYTCFWIPAVAYALRDRLALVAAADNTYTFQLGGLDRDTIVARVPDTPEEAGRGFLEEAFKALGEAAAERGDNRARLVHQLQHGAALAYVGEKRDARAAIEAARRGNRFSEHRPLIDAALRSPTYRPGGQRVVL
jgi:Methyltransferase domain